MSYYTNRINSKPYNEKGSLFHFALKITLFLLFLASLNVVNRFYYFVFSAFAVFMFFGNRYIRLNLQTAILFFFSLSLLIFREEAHSSFTSMLKCFTYVLCYIIGYNIFAKGDELEVKERKTVIVSTLLSLGTFLHLFLNLVKNAGKDVGRNTVDFWTEEIISATGQAALGCMVLGIAFAVLFSHYQIKYKLSAFLSLAILFYYNLILAGRTVFLMAIIVAVIAFLNYIKNSASPTQFLKVVFWTTVAILVLIIMYESNTFGIKETIVNSNYYNRFFGDKSYTELGDDTRLEFKRAYLKYLAVYLFGGGKINNAVGGYAHDLYLDTYDEAGVFAFVFIAVVSVSSILKLLKVLKNKEIRFETKQILLCLYTALHLEFWIEPILAGMPWLLAAFCVIHGMVCNLSESTTKNETEVSR